MGAADGTSWTDAFTTLQDALAAATSGDEIWIATGTYLPGTTRDASFAIPDGVSVYGGFIGTETSRSERDPDAHVVVLSGDLDADSGGDAGDEALNETGRSDDCLQVVTMTGGQLDGVTVRWGNADGAAPQNRGAGIYASGGGSIQIEDVTVENCLAAGNGGGICIEGGVAGTLADSIVRNNRSEASGADQGGGGIAVIDSPLEVSGCTISANYAFGSGGGVLLDDAGIRSCTVSGNLAGQTNSTSVPAQGGGIAAIDGCLVLLCTVVDNDARSDSAVVTGGGIYAVGTTSRTGIVGCLIARNRGLSTSGTCTGMGLTAFVNGAGVDIVNCTIADNTDNGSVGAGGGIYVADTGADPIAVVVTNTISWDNAASSAGTEELFALVEDPLVSHSTAEGGAFTHSMGAFNNSTDPEFAGAGDYRLVDASPAIDTGTDSAPLPVDLDGDDTDGNLVVTDLDRDLAGGERFVNGVDALDATFDPVIDRGAYEAQNEGASSKPGIDN